MSLILQKIYEKLSKGVIAFVNLVSLSHRDWPYNDFETAATATTYKRYPVGMNNANSHGDQTKLFVSKLSSIMVTTNSYVRFNHAGSQAHTLLANTWYNFQFNVHSVYYAAVQSAGTIYMHFGGTLPEEARSAH